jgi:AcrR family transcriptional regulator
MTSRSAARPKGARGVRLDRDTILVVAETILEQEGLDALTMRRVGAELGADPTALYRHFRNKEELVLELADRAFGRVPRVDTKLHWRDGLRQLAKHIRTIYEVHPDFAAVLVRQPDETPNLERLSEETLRLLAAAGLPPEEAAHVYAVLVNYVAGTGLFHAVVGEGFSAERRATSRRAYAALSPERFQYGVEAAPHLFPDPVYAFELGFEILLDAIEARARGRAGQLDSTGDEG